MPGTITDKQGRVREYDDAYLLDAGFKRDDKEREAHQSVADASDLDKGGPYFVQGVYKKGSVTIHFERNVSTLEQQGMETTTSHPQVCVISGPGGRVACSADDAELQLRVAEEVA